MEKIKVSIVGMNNGKLYHMTGMTDFEDVELSICDINENKLNEAGDEFSIPDEKRYVNYQKMLDTEKPDAVIVSMAQYSYKGQKYSPGVYFDIVNDVLDRKLNVMVEKPLAMTPEEARPLAEKAEKAGVISMVDVNRRFNPLVNFCLDEVRKRGPVLTTNCHFYKDVEIDQNDTTDWLTGDMIHALDLMRYINSCAEITTFHGAQNQLEQEAQPSGFYGLARFATGSIGIFSSNVRVGNRKEIWQIHGVGISAHIETMIDHVNFERLVKGRIYRDNNSYSPREYWDYNISGSDLWLKNRGFYDAGRYFVDCVKTNTQPHCNFSDGLKTVEYCGQILNEPQTIVKT